MLVSGWLTTDGVILTGVSLITPSWSRGSEVIVGEVSVEISTTLSSTSDWEEELVGEASVATLIVEALACMWGVELAGEEMIATWVVLLPDLQVDNRLAPGCSIVTSTDATEADRPISLAGVAVIFSVTVRWGPAV